MINTRILLIPLLVVCYAYLSAQTSDCNVGFDQISPALGEYFSTGSQFADADNDGDLDFFVFRPKDTESTTTIPPQIRLFQNNGTSFSLFLTLTTDRFDLADINGDGLIDIVSIDPDIGNSLRLYINTGTSFTFTTIYTAPTDVTFAGYPKFVDYDSDGDLDISCGVTRRSNGAVFILNNDGFQNFTKQELFAISGSGRNTVTDVKWADIDNDGDQDCWGLFEGADASGLFRTFPDIYLNQGNGTFNSATATPPSADRSVLEDFDNDGTVDMIVWGNGLGSNLLGSNFRFYRGGSSGTNGFVGNTNVGTDQNILDIITFDYDNNGFLDLFVYSRNDLTGASQHIIYRNENGVFTPGGSATNIIFSAPFFCDFNKDNVADYAQYYFTAVALGSRIEFFSGNAPQSTCPSNSRPKAPDNLGAEVTASSVKLSWQASDADQVSASLTYEIYLANQTTGQVIFAPTSDATTGLRKIAAPGKHGSQGSWTFNNLPDGEYAWRVQAIDHFYSGSPWSFGDFTIGQAACPDYQAGITVNNGFSKYSKFADFDGDGDKDLLVIREDGDTPSHLRLFENNNGTLTILDPWNENRILLDHFDLGDADNDGDIDILFVDKSAMYILVNEGTGFSRKEVFNSVEGWTTSRPSWIDYDNDGDLDIVHYNSVFFTQFNGLAFYENQGALQFEFSNSRPISGKTIIDLRVADFDRDGDVDIIVEESDPSIPDLPQEIRLYLNEGGPFIPGPSVGVTGQGIGGFDIGDVDNDGDIDVVGSGRFQFGASTRFYLNDNLNFAEVAVQDEGFGHVRLGDFDNDGFLDLAASTFEYTSSPSAPSTVQFTKLFRNTGGTSLIAESINFTVPGAQFVNVGVFPEWIDFNNDGILDIYHQFFASFNETNTELSFFDAGLLHINESSCERNTPPSPPSGLGVNIDGSDALLSWKEGFDPEQSPISLSYKAFLYDTENQVFIQPHAEPNKGYRHLVGMGNQFQNTSWLIKNLPDGSYCFKVQAIDHTFEGSEWSEEICFQITSCQLTAEAIALDPIICEGESANLRAISSGGNGTVTYQWNNNLGAGPAKTVTPATTTIYQVTATDEAGCIATDTTSVVVNPRPFVDAQPDTVLCQGESVTLTAVATGGSGGNYQFLWDNNLGDGPTHIVTPTISTAYAVLVRDGNACINSDTVTVVVNSLPIVIGAPDTTVCRGELITLSATASGGSGSSYSFAWNNGLGQGATHTIIADTSITYTVAVRDENNCTNTDEVNVIVNPLPSVDAGQDTTICEGEPVLLLAVPTGGSGANYQLLWDNGLGTGRSHTVNPDTTTTYNVIVRDGNDCTNTDQITVFVNPLPLVDAGVDTTICAGNEIMIVATATGGSGANYSFNWDNNLGQGASHTISPLLTTRYTVTLTDGNNCTAIDSILVTVNEGPIVVAADTAICLGNSAELRATATGGDGNYTFNWNIDTGGTTVTPTTTTTYLVTVTDGNGCTATDELTVTVNPIPIVSLGPDTSICVGETLLLVAQGSDGDGDYTFSWDNGLGQGQSQEVSPTVATTYVVTIQDGNTCESTDTINVGVNPIPTFTLESVQCDASLTTYTIQLQTESTNTIDVTIGEIIDNGGGSFTISAIPSTSNIVITINDPNTNCSREETITAPDCSCPDNIPEPISDGDQEICPGDDFPALSVTVPDTLSVNWYDAEVGGEIVFQASTTFTPTAVGTYYAESYITINGCPNPTRTAVSLSLLAPPIVSIVGDTILCAGETGILNAIGASTYLWSGGETTTSLTIAQAGSYSVIGTAENGCIATDTVLVIQGEALEGSFSNTDALCNGDASGSSTVNVTRGIAPYTYLWSNGATTPTIDGLTAGAYSVVVTDSNDCTFSGSTTIGESDPLGIISSTTEVSCPGGADGSASIAVTGGQTPYRFLWEDQNTTAERNDLAAGTYTVLVGDANDCEQEITIVISELPPIFIEPIRVQATSCFGVADGLIEVSVGGGTAPYILNWSNDANTSTIEALGAGDYTLNVVDANDCQFTSTFTITEPEPLAIDGTLINAASCEGASNGSIDLTIVGGTPPYRFEWSNGADTEDLTGVAAGTYSVVISDQNDCDVNGNFTIGNAGSIALFLTPFDATCALDNGRVTLDIEGGSAPYTYDWSNDGTGDNDDDANVEGLAAGTYTLSLTDAVGCVAFSEPVAIEAISPPVLEVVEVVPTICGESVGSINIAVSGGTEPYTYAWSNNTNAEDLSDIAEGTYTVVVTDANDCEISQEISITCFNPCVVNAGTMGQEKIMACQTEMITAIYDDTEEVIGEGDIRQFVIHTASGNVIGDIVFAILDEPIVNFLANQMMPGVEYYISAVVGKQGDDGQVDLSNECLDVAAGTPFSFARAPTAPAELTATNTTLCAGQALDLAVNVPLDGDISYLWETPRGVFTTGTPELTLENFTAEDQGDYFASYNVDGCESEQLGPLFITLDDRAAGVSAGEDQLSCGDISITMAAQLPENSTGTWFTSSPARIIDPTDPNTVVDSLISGENIFIWVGNTGNCIVRDSVTIYHAVSPVTEDKDILLAADKAALLLNKELLFDVITQSIPDSQFVFTITKQPEFGFLTDTLSGLYYLRDLDIQEDIDVSFVYEVCNDDPECGLLCSEATINISIKFLASEMIDYKQALRPEGKNPVWKFTLLRNLSDAKLSIVDRWGQLIYSQFYDSGEYNLLKGNTITGWNGENTKGVQLPAGAYYFLFEGTLADGTKPTPEKGILYLLK